MNILYKLLFSLSLILSIPEQAETPVPEAEVLSLVMATDLTISEDAQEVGYSGNFVDLTIPAGLNLTEYNVITFKLRGGDGGRRRVPGLCTKKGGGGATVTASFPIGPNGASQLRKGGTLRFIVGQNGANVGTGEVRGAGGGGGTAVLYQRPGATTNGTFTANGRTAATNSGISDNDNWVILAVAGGGGGAFSNGLCDADQGNNGRASERGDDGNGENGPLDQASGQNRSGGGGSAYVNGARQQFAGVSSPLPSGDAGLLTGGNGGSGSGFANGGFGFGGGGAAEGGGGGGGGYSAGSAQSLKGGGGGGSFVAEDDALSFNKQEGSRDGTPDNGFITYQFDFQGDINAGTQPPVAICKDTTVQIPGNERVALFASDFDDGSTDPNGLDLTFSFCNSRTDCFDPASNSGYQCNNLGRTLTELIRVSNGVKEDFCDVRVEVEQGPPGTFICPANVTAEIDPDVCGALVGDVIDAPPSLRNALDIPSFATCMDSLAFKLSKPVMNSGSGGLVITPTAEMDTHHISADSRNGLQADTFELGVSTVRYTSFYFDENGDRQTQSCSFTVTVTDDLMLDCPRNVVVEERDNEGDPCNEQLRERDVTPDFGCGDLTYVITNNNVAGVSTNGEGVVPRTFDIGEYTVEYTLSNRVETETCSFTVTIEGDVNDGRPRAGCSGPIREFFTADLTEEDILSQIDAGSSVDCGEIVLTEILGFNFDCSELEESQEVTLRVTSSTGQTDQCMTSVFLDEVMRAQLDAVCKNITIELDETGNYTLDPAELDDGSFYNPCGQTMPFSADITSFDCTQVGQSIDVEFSVSNPNGDIRSETCQVTVADNTDPVAICPTTVPDVELDANGDVSISADLLAGNSTDNCGIATEVNATPSFDCISTGTQTIQLVVTDVNGNTNSTNCNINVVDTAPPTFTCPDDMEVVANGNANCEVTIPNLTLLVTDERDNCGFPLFVDSPIRQNPSALSTQNVSHGAIIMVELSLTDAFGNEDVEDCIVELTVVDDTPPVARCGNRIFRLMPDGTSTLTPVFIDEGSTDNCGTPSLSINPTDFDCSNLGVNTITLTATDANDNTTTCESTVTFESAFQLTTITRVYCAGQTIDLTTSESALINRTGTFTYFQGAEMITNPEAYSPSGDETITVEFLDDATGCDARTNGRINLEELPAPEGNIALSRDFICPNETSDLEFTLTTGTYPVELTVSGLTGIDKITLNDENSTFEITASMISVGANAIMLTNIKDNRGCDADLDQNVGLTLDNIAPTFTCPSSATVNTTGSANCEIEVPNFTDLVMDEADNCSLGTNTLQQNPVAGTRTGLIHGEFFDVTLSLTDEAGNTKSDCLFQLQVQDDDNPVARCQDTEICLDENGMASLDVADFNNGSSDNCSIDRYALSQSSFTEADLGTSSVTLTVFDANNNTDNASCAVSVIGLGNIEVIHIAAPADDTDFDYRIEDASASEDNFSLAAPSNTNQSYSNLKEGAYTVSVTPAGEFDLKNIQINGDTDNGSSIDLENQQIIIDLDAGEDISVTFVHELPSSITITKDAIGDASDLFSFTQNEEVSGDDVEFLRSITVPNLPSGTFFVPEDMALLSNGDLLVSNEGRGLTVSRFNPSGSYIGEFTSEAGSKGLSFPIALDVSKEGEVFIFDIDNTDRTNPIAKIKVYDEQGNFLRSWGDFGDGPGLFNNFVRLSIAETGEIYIIEEGEAEVEVFDKFGILINQWTVPSNKLSGASGITDIFHFQGRVYVSLFAEPVEQVKVFDEHGKFLFEFGELGFAEGQLGSPFGISISPQGEIFFGDRVLQKVQVFDINGNFLYEWGDPGGMDGQFNSPRTILFNDQGEVLVMETIGSRIQVFSTPNPTFILQPSTNPSQSFSDLNPGNYTFTENEFSRWCLNDIQISGDLDNGSSIDLENRSVTIDLDPGEDIEVTFVNEEKGSISVVKSADPADDTPFKFKTNYPILDEIEAFQSRRSIAFIEEIGLNVEAAGVAASNANRGEFLISDSANNQIHVFDLEGEYLRSFGETGSGDGQLNNPGRLAVDIQGNVFVVDRGNARVQLFDNQGNHLGYLTSSANLNEPAFISVSDNGSIALYEEGINVISLFDNNFNGLNAENFFNVTDIQMGTDNLGYITAPGFGVVTFDPDRTALDQFIDNTVLSNPSSIEFSALGEIYILDGDSKEVKVFDSEGDFIRSFGGNDGNIDGEFFTPFDIAAAGTEAFIVLDKDVGEVTIFNARNTFTLQDPSDNTLVLFDLEEGTYTFSEEELQGWCLSDLQISGDADNGSNIDLNNRTATIDLDRGEDIELTFVNKATALTITNTANPADDTAFNTTLRKPDASEEQFSLQNPSNPSASLVAIDEGQYRLIPERKRGWCLIDVQITGDLDDGSRIFGVNGRLTDVVIDLDKGEAIEVILEYEKVGSITIIKDAGPEDDTSFDYVLWARDQQTTGEIEENFSLQDPSNNSITFDDLVCGRYFIQECFLPGWSLEDIQVLGDGAAIDLERGRLSINLDVGDDIEITFVNKKLGSIQVNKSADPADDTPFDFSFSGENEFTLEQSFNGNGSTTLDGKFVGIQGMAIDAAGNIYVAEITKDRVQKFDSNGNLLLTIETAGTAEGELNGPQYLAIDAAGNIWVTEETNNRIQQFDPNGNFLQMWGWGVATGANQFEICTSGCLRGIDGDGNGQFDDPTGIVLDEGGNIYVIDNSNYTLQKFTAAGGFVFQIENFIGSNGSIDDFYDLEFNSEQQLYITGQNDIIFVYNSDGTPVQAINLLDENNQGLTATGLAIDAEDNFFISNDDDNFIRKYDKDGNLIEVLGIEVNDVLDLDFDQEGNLWMADNNFEIISKLKKVNQDFQLRDPSNSSIDLGLFRPGTYTLTEAELSGWCLDDLQISGDTDGGSSIDLVNRTATIDLDFGEDIALTFLNKANTITITNAANPANDTPFSATLRKPDASEAQFSLQNPSDASEIFTATEPGTYTLIPENKAGWCLVDIEILGDLDNGSRKNTNGSIVTSVLIDADKGETIEVILKYEKAGTITINKVADPADDTPFSFTLNGAVTENFDLQDPGNSSITFDELKCGSYTIIEQVPFGWSLESITVAGEDRVTTDTAQGRTAFTLDTNEDVVITYTNKKLGTISVSKSADPADDTPFNFQFSGTERFQAVQRIGGNGSQFGAFNNPLGMTFDANGDFYVADASNDRIQKFDAVGNLLFAFGSSGTAEGQLDGPAYLAFDAAGNLWVTESNNHRIQQFDAAGNFLQIWGWGVATGADQFEICTSGCLKGKSGAGDGQFDDPLGIAIDDSGNLYVANDGDDYQKFASDGTFIYKVENFPGAGSSPDYLYDIAFNTVGNLYLTGEGGAVYIFDQDGNFIGTVAVEDEMGNELENYAIAFDEEDYIYIGSDDDDSIRKYDPAGNFIEVVAFVGSPYDLEFDAQGNLWAVAEGDDVIVQLKKLDLEFHLSDPSTPNKDLGFFRPGTYTLTEEELPNWGNKNIQILGDDDNGSVIDLFNRTINIDMDFGEEIEIIFENRSCSSTDNFIQILSSSEICPGGEFTLSFHTAPNASFQVKGATAYGITSDFISADNTGQIELKGTAPSINLGESIQIDLELFSWSDGCVASLEETFFIIDDQAPNAICKSATIQLDAAGLGTLNPADIDDNSTDNCEIVSRFINAQASLDFDCNDIGLQQITLSLKDPTGNESTCSANVKILASDACPDPVITNMGGPTIADPCTCSEDYPGYLQEEILIRSINPGEAWRIKSSSGLIDPDNFAAAFPADLAFTDLADNRYSLVGLHEGNVGYSLVAVSEFWPGVELPIRNICDLPMVVAQNKSLCSGQVSNLLLGASTNNTGVVKYDIISIDYDASKLIPIAGNPMVEQGVNADVIADDAWSNPGNQSGLVTYTLLPIGPDGCAGFPFEVALTIEPERMLKPIFRRICSNETLGIELESIASPTPIQQLRINSFSFGDAKQINGTSFQAGMLVDYRSDLFKDLAFEFEGSGSTTVNFNISPINTKACEGNAVNISFIIEQCSFSCTEDVRVNLGNDCSYELSMSTVTPGKGGDRFGYYILVNDWTPGDNIITSPGTFQYAILQDIGFDGDPSNDINICWGTVIAEDKSDPVVMPPADKYLECWLLDDVLNNPGTVAPAGDGDGENSDPATFDGGDGDDDNDLGFPKVTDGCEGHLIPFKWSDAVVYYDCDSPYDTKDYRVTAVLTRRFSAADAQGNQTTATQTIYFVGPRTSIDGDNNVTSADYWGWGPLVDPSDRDGDGVKFYYDVEAGLWVYTLQSCDAPSEQVGELYPYYTGQLDCETGQFNQLVDIDPAPDNVVLGPDYRDAFGNKVRLDEVNCNLSVQTDNRQFSDVCSDGSYKQERHLRIFDWCEGSSDGTAFPYLVKVGDFAPPVLDNCVLNPLDVPGVRRRTNFGDAETVIELLNGDTDGDGDLENDQIRPEHIEAGQITFFDDEDEELKDEGYTVSVCLEMVSTGPMDCTASLNTDLGALRALWGKQLVQDCEDPTVTSEIYSYSEVYVGGFPTGEYAWQIGGYSMVGTMAVGIPEGLHALVISATDGCYNNAIGIIFFQVMDGTKPVMKCDDELRVTLVDGDPKLGIQGYALVSAQDVDEGSWDNCGPVTLEVRRVIDNAATQADWEAKNGRALIDEYDDEDADYNRGYTGWADFVEFFCGDLTDKVTVELRGSDDKKIFRRCIENCTGPESGKVYEYSSFRKTQDQQDREGWEGVYTPNQSICWLDIDVENGTNYTVELELTDGQLACTDEFDYANHVRVDYFGLQCESPDIEVVVEPELDQCGIGRYKIYLKDNIDVESKNRPNVDGRAEYVYVVADHQYWIKFPKDARYDCGEDQEVAGVETSADLDVACDLLAISTLPDERFAATSDPDACYKIFRTYRVINWCEYDGQQDPVVVSRDWDRWNGFDFGTSTTSDDRDPNARREYNINPQFPDGDDNPGNTDLYVIVKRNLNDDLVDRVFYDADSDPTANVGEVSTDQPRFGSNGSGNTDVETYWWQVTSGSRGIVDLAPAGNSSNDYFGDTEANEPDWDLDTNNESYYDGSYRGQPVRWGYDPNVSNNDPNGSANDSSDNDDDQYYGSVGFWQYTQHIIVYDDTAPEVRVEAEQECAINGETCDAETSFDIVITDVCSLDDITLKVYVNGEAASNVALNATDTAVIATVTGRRGLGNYKITGEVNDGCGNITPFDGELEVVDCKAPAPICKENLVVELMPADAGGQQGNTSGSAGMNVLWAKDFIGSPVGDCSGQGPEEVLVGNDQYLPMITKYSINRLDSAVADSLTSLVVTCADEGLMVEVEIHAWDELGNHDFCRTSIIVQDNNGVCNLSGATGNIAGVIETEQAAKLEGVEVQLSGAQSKMYITNFTGKYAFDNLVLGHDFSVIPHKDDNHGNGVSTFDLILIQKHILGVQELDSPYKLIAADANNSKSISTLDLIQVRKLILNIETEFANNTSWRFVDADYIFPDADNPWQEAFPEVRNINNLEEEEIVNFMAVKIGDVNASARVNSSQVIAPRNVSEVLELRTFEMEMEAGQVYDIPILAGMEGVAGFQFTMEFNPQYVDFIELEERVLRSENFGIFAREGILTASYHRMEELPGDKVELFTLRLKARENTRLSEVLGITSRLTVSEAYSLDEKNEVVEDRTVALIIGDHLAERENVLYQNRPNPFKAETIIGFKLADQDEVELEIKDVQGRRVFYQKTAANQGYNEWRIKAEDLPSGGIYFYTLSTKNGFQATKRMIRY